MIEGLVEDPHRLHVLERRQVLAAEDQDLVGPEGLAQGLRGGLVHRLGQVDALDLGPDQGAGRTDFEAADQGLGQDVSPSGRLAYS